MEYSPLKLKDIGRSLDEAERSGQFQRYRSSLNNLVLTDYLEFRPYADGERRLVTRLATRIKDGRARHDKTGVEAFTWLFDDLLSHPPGPVGTHKENSLPIAERTQRANERSKQRSDQSPDSCNHLLTNFSLCGSTGCHRLNQFMNADSWISLRTSLCLTRSKEARFLAEKRFQKPTKKLQLAYDVTGQKPSLEAWLKRLADLYGWGTNMRKYDRVQHVRPRGDSNP